MKTATAFALTTLVVGAFTTSQAFLPATAPVRRANHVMRMEAGEGTTSRPSPINRRDIISNVFWGSMALAGLALPQKANAGFFGGANSELESKLNEVAQARGRVEEVLKSLKKRELRGGPEDSIVVYRYSQSYFKPTQEKMLGLVPLINLGDEEKQKRFQSLPLLLKGHLLELDAAIKSQKASEQLEEVEEVAETIDEFLALAKTKLGEGAVKDYLVDRTEEEMKAWYGAFTCEQFGRQKLPDSNQCVDPKDLQ